MYFCFIVSTIPGNKNANWEVSTVESSAKKNFAQMELVTAKIIYETYSLACSVALTMAECRSNHHISTTIIPHHIQLWKSVYMVPDQWKLKEVAIAMG